MATDIALGQVEAILLPDGWHTAVSGTAQFQVVTVAGQSPGGTWVTFSTGSEGVACPVTSIQAIRYTLPGGP